jgi:HAD superfamily hydrolase (TIGR01509 family)
MLKAILFDLDGTLVNSDPLHYLTWAKVLEIYQITIDHHFYQTRISGRTNAEIVGDLFPEFSDEDILKMVDLKELKFRELAIDLQPLPGLMDFLAGVNQQGFKTGLVTNAPRKNTDFILEILKLSNYFDTVVLSDEIGIGKPDPAPYQYCLEQLSILPEEAIAFEDSPSGIRSAIAAGIKTIGVASTHAPNSLKDLGVGFVIEDFTQIDLQKIHAKI